MIDPLSLAAGVILGAVWGWNLSRWSKPPPKDARLWQTRVINALDGNGLVVQRFQPRLLRSPDWVVISPKFYGDAAFKGANAYAAVIEKSDASLLEEAKDAEETEV